VLCRPKSGGAPPANGRTLKNFTEIPNTRTLHGSRKNLGLRGDPQGANPDFSKNNDSRALKTFKKRLPTQNDYHNRQKD
jgi:hypothetical protein